MELVSDYILRAYDAETTLRECSATWGCHLEGLHAGLSGRHFIEVGISVSYFIKRALCYTLLAVLLGFWDRWH